MKNTGETIEQVLLDTRKNDTRENLIFMPLTTKEQMDEIAVLATKIWHEHYASILTKNQIDYMVDQFQSASAIANQIENEGYQYFGMIIKNTMVGYCAFKEEAEEKRLFLSKIYIHKQYRGCGYASLAFDFLVQWCQERGYQKIWLTVNRFNETSIHVYEKKGFVKTRTQVADIGNGFVMDDYIMEKIIEAVEK